MYAAGGRLRHSAQTILAIKAALGFGPDHPSFGTKRTDAQILANRLGSYNRIPIYQYTPDFIFTGLEFISITQAWEVTKIHIDKLVEYIDTSVLLEGHLYSTFKPSMHSDGSCILPQTDRPIPDPFLGVRESMILSLRVEQGDYSHYFLSPSQVAKVVNNGTIWTGKSIKSERIYNVARTVETPVFSVKRFIMLKLTREEFLNWYITATPEQQIMSIPSVETRRKRVK
jgi:hypothetical protein